MRENVLVQTLRALFSSSDPSVVAGSGPDDCAHVVSDGTRLAFSTDAFVEGVHFLPGTPPRHVARKALAASLSDLAASACRARWALVSLCPGKGLGDSWADEFARGLAETAGRYGVAIVGGDTTASRSATFVSVTVAGEPLPGGPVLRSGGRPGDVLAVTGELGGSLKGKHLNPVPRLAEMRRLMEFCSTLRNDRPCPGAAMDISDGLALDLSRLCRESGVGAIIDEEAVPVSREAVETALETGRRPIDHALSDGEDFELLIALPPDVWRKYSDYQTGCAPEEEFARFTRIGTLMPGGILKMRGADGVTRPLAAEGYEHLW